MLPEADPQPRHWYATNLVGVPSCVLGSAEFNAHPRPLHIVGTREAHAGLFHLLAACGQPAEAAEVFMHYLSIAFGLQPESAPTSPSEARRWRASYIKLLQGWGGDSNGPAGAVLKGWVESRFGLVPCYHRGLLGRYPSPPWVAYMEEKATSRFHNNCIHQQLDLLYEFCQWALRRHAPFGRHPTLTLWRGVNQVGEHEAWSEDGSPLTWRAAVRRVVRFNNVLSFALDPRQAECFGDTVLKVQVPQVKLLFYPGLLSKVPLSGESEVLAIGGDMAAEVWRA
ncbi:MAG: hypothetical protein RI907_30 [Pseudomonadota bacterium]|jgi:NAD+--dinitrogen-reductase ADP-D-ribosyltransferase